MRVSRSKHSSGAKAGKRAREKVAPLIFLFQAGVVLNKHWHSLSVRERARLARLLRASRGRPGKLSAKERGELRKLVVKLDLRHLGRDLVPLIGGAARTRWRRRR